MATLTWLGHSAFRLETDRGKRVYVDPFLTGNPKTPEAEKTPEHIDVIAITHGHGDHVGDAVALSQRFPDAEIVCQVELKRWLGLKGANVGETPGLNKGGTHRVGDVFFTLTDAEHSSSSDDGEYLGEPCGIVIQLEDGVPVYFAGDTCMFGDMQLIRHLYEPQLAVLPIGDHFTMGPREAAIALDMLGRPRCVPCHWGTFPLLTGTPQALAALAEDVDVVEIQPGDTIEVYVTYSIVACDLDAEQWGVATASKFLGVGAIVPWAEPHIGAVATQAWANPRYGPEGLRLLRGGLPAQEVLETLVSEDDGREHPQLGVVDATGRAASYTGTECLAWAGGVTGDGFAAQGNILVSGVTVEALALSFAASPGKPLAERLLDSLDAAHAAGGDRRGQQSAAVLVVERDGGYGGLSDTVVDLRVDDHETPLDELRRLHGIHELLFGKTPRDQWLAVDDELGAELRERLGRLGYDGALAEALSRWAGVENLEERVDGAEHVDPVVLEELRKR